MSENEWKGVICNNWIWAWLHFSTLCYLTQAIKQLKSNNQTLLNNKQVLFVVIEENNESTVWAQGIDVATEQANRAPTPNQLC